MRIEEKINNYLTEAKFYMVVKDNNLQKGKWVVGQGLGKSECLRKAEMRLNGVHGKGIESLVVVKANSIDDAREKAESGDVIKSFK